MKVKSIKFKIIIINLYKIIITLTRKLVYSVRGANCIHFSGVILPEKGCSGDDIKLHLMLRPQF